MVKLLAYMAVAATFHGGEDATSSAFVYEMSSNDAAPYARSAAMEVRTVIVVRPRSSTPIDPEKPSGRYVARPPSTASRLLYAAQGQRPLACAIVGVAADGDLICEVQTGDQTPLTLVWHTGEITEASRM